jgi:hypothetical protein
MICVVVVAVGVGSGGGGTYQPSAMPDDLKSIK